MHNSIFDGERQHIIHVAPPEDLMREATTYAMVKEVCGGEPPELDDDAAIMTLVFLAHETVLRRYALAARRADRSELSSEDLPPVLKHRSVWSGAVAGEPSVVDVTGRKLMFAFPTAVNSQATTVRCSIGLDLLAEHFGRPTTYDQLILEMYRANEPKVLSHLGYPYSPGGNYPGEDDPVF